MITCEDCIHWEERSMGGRRWGRCCINPPTVFFDAAQDQGVTLWPETLPEDSCSKASDTPLTETDDRLHRIAAILDKLGLLEPPNDERPRH